MTTATAVLPTRFAIRPILVSPPAAPRRVTTPIAITEVIDLIEAAGPLTIRDIAGGLAVSERCAAGRVRQMVDRDCLREDEFGRYRLWGDRAMA